MTSRLAIAERTVDPEPLDPRTIDWEREFEAHRAPARREGANRRRGLFLVLAAVVPCVVGTVLLVSAFQRRERLAELRSEQVRLRQEIEHGEVALRARWASNILEAAWMALRLGQTLGGDPDAGNAEATAELVRMADTPEDKAEMAQRGASIARAMADIRALGKAKRDLEGVERGIASLGERP